MSDPQTLRSSLRLGIGSEVAMGPGKAQLLQLIGETGSIASAGRRIGMSYKRAWSLVATMNRCFRGPLVVVSRGGSDHGGAVVTVLGESVLAAYRRLADLVEASEALGFIRANVAEPDAPAESSGSR